MLGGNHLTQGLEPITLSILSASGIQLSRDLFPLTGKELWNRVFLFFFKKKKQYWSW